MMTCIAHHFQAYHTIYLFLVFSGLFGINPASHVLCIKYRRFLQCKRNKRHGQIEVFPVKQCFDIPGRLQLDGDGTGIIISPHGTGNRVIMGTQQVSAGRIGI